ncbi:protein phosphatase 1 regulatory subunit 14C [Cyanistes caeruleus]|uniref:protein phosphatase 1 regulatory subunit 14C n=1 Tax=Cyanistes caeruleus TaxID=156563 RepID=UPI000CD9FCE1|nr:protein phosphatase 1 regulatory subunit 14C [Cyanistes caeruleus]
MEGSFSSGGTRRLRQLREYQETSWPSAGELGGCRACAGHRASRDGAGHTRGLCGGGCCRGKTPVREEEMPEVEIDIDDLLDAANEEERALKLQETLVDCYKPTEEFIKELLTRIRGMRKLSPPQKKSI